MQSASRYHRWIYLVLAAVLLASCQPAATSPSAEPKAVEAAAATNVAEATQLAEETNVAEAAQVAAAPQVTAATYAATAAVAKPTATATRPAKAATRTPAPTKTKGPAPTSLPTLTPPAGLVFTPMWGQPPEGYVLAYDPARWKVGSSTERKGMGLIHQTIAGCDILTISEGRGVDTPDRLLRKHLGRLPWELYVYQDRVLAGRMLWLDNYQDAQCAADQEAVLATMLREYEILQSGYLVESGVMVYGVPPTRTPAPPPPTPEGFSCPNTPPPQLKAGFVAYIVAKGGVWLRSSPDSNDDKNRVEKYSADSPVSIVVREGPVCGGKYVYWKVSISPMGFGGEEVTGWMAEGDMNEIYLATDF